MNFSQDNRATLSTLLAALGNGVSGEQAAPILAATLSAQQAQQDARTQRYQDMASQVAGMAGSGYTYGGVKSYLDTMTPQQGIPGRFQGLLDQAFANPDIPPGWEGQLPTYGGGGPGLMDQPSQWRSQVQSPMFTQNPANGPTMMGPGGNLMGAENQARQAMFQQQAAAQPPAPNPSAADVAGLVAARITQRKAAGQTPQQIAQSLSQDPEAMGAVMTHITEFMQMAPDVIGLLVPGAAGQA